jgi:hypothetical protein
MAMAEDDRPPAAHEIDIAVTVNVPERAALAPREILRIAGRQGRRVLMTPHRTGHDAAGALDQGSVPAQMTHRGSRHLVTPDDASPQWRGASTQRMTWSHGKAIA